MAFSAKEIEMYAKLKTVYQKFGFKWFTGKENFNIIGIRSDMSNKYNDTLVVIELNDDTTLSYIKICNCATHPGLGWLGNAMGNPEGTFILKDNEQYFNCWEIRKHRGLYDALCQIYGYKGFCGYRDSNKNGVIDITGDLYNNVQGLNLHTTKYTALINTASAGCQVIQNSKDFNELMVLFKEAKTYGVETFSYTLINKTSL